MIFNIGISDSIARALLGLALFLAPLVDLPPVWSESIYAYVSMAIGVVLMGTALFRFCPLYRVFGISTCKV